MSRQSILCLGQYFYITAESDNDWSLLDVQELHEDLERLEKTLNGEFYGNFLFRLICASPIPFNLSNIVAPPGCCLGPHGL